MSDKASRQISKSIPYYVLGGMVLLLALVGGLGGWAFTAKISGAVVATGRVVVETNVKKVQHREGGIVGEIFIKNGDEVKSGQVLIRLDKTREQANLAYVENQWIEQIAKRARLLAERDGVAKPVFDPLIVAMTENEAAKAAIDGEVKLFGARRATRQGQIEQLNQRISQYGQQIGGLKAQRKENEEQKKLIDEQIDSQEKLKIKGLHLQTKLLGLKADRSKLDATESQLVAQVAVVEDKISETKLQKLQIEKDFLENVLRELRDVDAKIAGFREQRITALDKLKRMEIISPYTGTVHELQVHTVGGVISPGEPILQIVPKGDKLIVEAEIAPVDIDEARKGKDARINFSAFNQRDTEQIFGKVIGVSADQIKDARTGVGYFTVRIEVDDDNLRKLGDRKIVPGMPTEVFIQTRERTVIAYLLEPLVVYFDQMFAGG